MNTEKQRLTKVTRDFLNDYINVKFDITDVRIPRR